MTSSAAKFHAVIAVLAASLAACSPTKPPTDVLGVASRNVAAARGAEAAKYAPQELRVAEDHLAAANAASARQDYDKATVLAGESAVDSELAAAKARLGKAREAADGLRQQNAELTREAARHSEGADAQ
ncbi:MAG TPA: DUF4398 domain-containing protein [Rhodanobacteraceae bacterium]|nr:DUF4398 domain-containing protein [Rhodanobacteraceae bacterium]